MVVIFLPLMAIIIVILLPINFNGGKDQNVFRVGGKDIVSYVEEMCHMVSLTLPS